MLCTPTGLHTITSISILEKLKDLQIKNAIFIKVERLLHEVSEQIVCIVNNIILGHQDTQINILIERLKLFKVV
jgi:hypothetical protein